MAEPVPRRPNLVVLALVGVVVLALVAVIISATGGDDDDGGAGSTANETREVEVTGADLAPFEDPANDPAVGQPAPVVSGEMFNGHALTVPADGRPAVLVFFAHWCPHCQREVPFLVSYFEENGMPEGVDIFGVTTGVDPASPNYPPSEWLARERWVIPTLIDSGESRTGRAFGLSAYPFFVAIDADGNVVARTSGELEAPQLEALLDAARNG